jgi:hypothetical protein
MKSQSFNYLVRSIESKSESFAHKVIKQLFYKKIKEYNPDIVEASLEKDFESRRADVYFRFKSGQEIVVEIQNSPISSREITVRTKDYNHRGIYVLWVLYGDGRCVGSPKNPKNDKNKKISPAELRLHNLYRGRVYYVNLRYKEEKVTATLPFGLHFSYSDTIAPILFKKHFKSFFIRNVNFKYIPNWKIFCTTYNNYKIARFYDQNTKTSLIREIRQFSKRNNIFKNKKFKKSKKTKNFLKIMCNMFYEDYGTRLNYNEELFLNERFLTRYKARIKRKAQTKMRKLKI